MKNMMKKALSVIIALAMILVPMSVFAATGDYDEPYQLSTTSVRFYVEVAPEATVWIQADDYNNSIVEVGYATGTDYFLQYGRQSVYPEADGTASLTLSGYDMFSVYNYGTETIYVYMSLTAGAPVDTTGTMDDPKEVTLAANMFGGVGAYEEVALEADNQGYWFTCTAPADGIITVEVNALDADYNYIGWMYNVTNATTYSYGDTHWSDEENPVYYEEWEVKAGDELVVFASTYDPTSWSNPAGTVAVNFTFDGVGSSYYPEVLDATGSYATYITAGSWGYYYTWTATEAGTVTVAMDDASGWQYSVMVEPAAEDAAWYYGDLHTYADEPVVASESVEVAAGDIVTVNVCTFDAADMWNAPAGTVNWTLSFVAGSTGDGGDGDQGGEDIGGGDTGEDVNYAISGDVLVVGENVCVVDGGYQYTLYAFEPTETGKYTITSNDSLLGNLGGTWHYYQDPTADNVNSSTLVWECTSVGQSAIIAVMANTNIANITITREDLDTSDEVQWTVYDNTTTPAPFEYEGDASELVPVDIENDIIDSAVLGEDGYYHLNSPDGPILYANLNDGIQSLAAIIGYGKLSAVYYDDESGAVVAKVDYTEAVTEYINCAYVDDSGALYYPLTADLIEMFQEVGATNEWYDGYTWVHDSADAWMFACYYVETVPGGSNEGNEGGDNAGDNNTGSGDAVADPEIPNTGNEAFGVAIAMMATVAALGATAVVTKKSKRVK